MHYTDHNLLSQNKYKSSSTGDFILLHKFIDSSKNYYWNFKHRSLLHTIDYGSYLLHKHFGEVYNNVPINSLLIDHIKEDTDLQTPRLKDWFKKANFSKKLTQISLNNKSIINNIQDLKVLDYLLTPELLSNIPELGLIPTSDFGINYYSKDKSECYWYYEMLVSKGVHIIDIRELLECIVPGQWCNKVHIESLNKIRELKNNNEK